MVLFIVVVACRDCESEDLRVCMLMLVMLFLHCLISFFRTKSKHITLLCVCVGAGGGGVGGYIQISCGASCSISGTSEIMYLSTSIYFSLGCQFMCKRVA